MSGEPKVLGAILAGGQARRLGARGKSRLELGGRPLISHVLDRIRGQVSRTVVNAPEEFRDLGLSVVPDLSDGGRVETFAGPLVGILSVLEWAAREGGFGWVATFPTDTPFLPLDFTARALQAVTGAGAELACAASGDRVHPVIGLWPVGLAPALRRAVVDEGLRRADGVLERFRAARISYPATPIDPFFNVNTPDDLAEAERILAADR